MKGQNNTIFGFSWQLDYIVITIFSCEKLFIQFNPLEIYELWNFQGKVFGVSLGFYIASYMTDCITNQEIYFENNVKGTSSHFY